MSLQEAYYQKYEAQLLELDAQIQKIEAKAMKAETSAKILYYEELQAIYRKRDKAAQKLEALKKAGNEAWQEMKAGLEAAWHEFRTGVHNAAVRFTDH